MTGEQADWLRKNKQYRAVGQVPAGHTYADRGILRPDGTFVPTPTRWRPNPVEGQFEVGILRETANLARR